MKHTTRGSRIVATAAAAVLLISLGCAERPTDVIPTGPALSTHAGPLVVTWWKSWNDQLGHWQGTASGDLPGALTVHYVSHSERGNGNVWEVTLIWMVDGQFTTTLSGLIHWQSGIVRLNGYVDSGPLAGARVVHTGQLGRDGAGNYTAFLAPATGTIRIIP